MIRVQAEDFDVGVEIAKLTKQFPGAGGVVHDIDLGGDGVSTPDHDQVALRHLARVAAAQGTRAHNEAGPSQVDADALEIASLFKC